MVLIRKSQTEKVISALKEYKALKISVDNETLFKDKLEEIGERKKKCEMIERTLKEALSETERQIIEMKYLGESPGKDIQIFLDLRINKNQYYALKKQAIKQIAIALMLNEED